MNKKILFPLALVPLAATGLQAQKSAQTQRVDKRPNIILFMVDDMGWQDTSLPFWTQKTDYNKLYETPNMERLAKQGMMFTQAYASSISSPTRCSLITGTNAARHRVTNWTLQKNTKTDRKDKVLDVPDWNYNGVSQVPGTNNTFVGTSFVQLLKDSGYHTIHCGKAHFGAIDTPGEDPHHWGFEVNIAGHAAGGLASYLGEENYGHNKDGKPISLMAVPGLEKYWGTETFVTEALTLEAIKALNKAKKYNQPFYLYMSQYAIHVPLDKDKRFYDKYKKKGMTDHEAAYATLIEGMDKSLGDLMDWLEKSGEADNTIIIFMSDNGGLAAESYWRDGKLHTQNHPLNSGKGSTYEGGIREPMIVSWPGVVAPGSKCNDYLLIEDFYPTILEMAGIKKYNLTSSAEAIPKTRPSLLSCFTNADSPKPQLQDRLSAAGEALEACSETALQSWFDPLEILLDQESGTLAVRFPHAFFGIRFSSLFQKLFEKKARELWGKGLSITYGAGKFAPAPPRPLRPACPRRPGGGPPSRRGQPDAFWGRVDIRYLYRQRKAQMGLEPCPRHHPARRLPGHARPRAFARRHRRSTGPAGALRPSRDGQDPSAPGHRQRAFPHPWERSLLRFPERSGTAVRRAFGPRRPSGAAVQRSRSSRRLPAPEPDSRQDARHGVPVPCPACRRAGDSRAVRARGALPPAGSLHGSGQTRHRGGRGAPQGMEPRQGAAFAPRNRALGGASRAGS